MQNAKIRSWWLPPWLLSPTKPIPHPPPLQWPLGPALGQRDGEMHFETIFFTWRKIFTARIKLRGSGGGGRGRHTRRDSSSSASSWSVRLNSRGLFRHGDRRPIGSFEASPSPAAGKSRWLNQSGWLTLRHLWSVHAKKSESEKQACFEKKSFVVLQRIAIPKHATDWASRFAVAPPHHKKTVAVRTLEAWGPFRTPPRSVGRLCPG